MKIKFKQPKTVVSVRLSEEHKMKLKALVAYYAKKYKKDEYNNPKITITRILECLIEYEYHNVFEKR